MGWLILLSGHLAAMCTFVTSDRVEDGMKARWRRYGMLHTRPATWYDVGGHQTLLMLIDPNPNNIFGSSLCRNPDDGSTGVQSTGTFTYTSMSTYFGRRRIKTESRGVSALERCLGVACL